MTSPLDFTFEKDSRIDTVLETLDDFRGDEMLWSSF